jgi:DNA-binding NarL/FixJ family response regulator
MDELKKVLVVDDHKSMRDFLEREFTPEHGFMVVEGIGCAKDAEAFCIVLRPDLIIMDVCTDFGASGLDAAQKILKSCPDTKIIVTSGFEGVTYMPRAKELGAHAFVYKINGGEFYREVAVRVLNGEYVFPDRKTIPVSNGETPFTKRELEVLRLYCNYMTTKEIAETLTLSEATVRKHIENMREKVGAKSAMNLVAYVLSNGWINPNY